MEKICIQRIPLCIVHTWCTELSLCLQAFVTSSIWLFLECKYRSTGRSRKSSHVQLCQENQKWRHIGATVYTNSQLISPPDKEWGQTVLTCGIQWVCHAINKISYICVFSKPPKTGILRPPYLQNYLAYACCMKAALRWYTLCPHTELPEIDLFSTQYWLLIVIHCHAY